MAKLAASAAVLFCSLLPAQTPPSVGQLEVCVRDGLGAPLPAVEVRAEQHGRALATARTDGSGIALLSRLPLGGTTVWATAKDFAVTWQSADLLPSQPRQQVLFELVETEELCGCVRANGKPVAEALVLVIHTAERVLTAIRTDAAGNYRAPAGLGSNDVLVIADGFALARARCRVRAPLRQDFALQAARSHTLTLRVAAASPEQLATARASVQFVVAGDELRLPTTAFCGVLDEHGEWTLRGLPAELQARYVGVDLPDADVAFADEPMQSDDGAIYTGEVRPRLPVCGHVTDADGLPLAGVQVLCRPDAGDEFLATSDTSGRFATAPAMAAGEFGFLRLGDPGLALAGWHRPQDLRLPIRFDPQQPIELRTVAGGSIRGRVLDRGGHAARFAVVVLRDAGRGEWIATTCTDAEGHFVVGSLPPAWACEAELSVSGFNGIARLQGLQLPVQRDFEVPPLRLHPGGEIHGRVLEVDGSPAVGALVFVRPAHLHALTDRQGRFRIGALPAAKYEVRAAFRLLEVRDKPAMATVELADDASRELEVRLGQ